MTPGALLRPTRSLRPLLQSSSIPRRRWASSVGPSLTGEFYKTFTRPVAKCLLLAMFTYQLAYYAWVKLETDEIRHEKDAEIASLEEQVKALQSKAAKP
ncbi:hypothetical protein NKR19_g7185 [Coniochaeta hoffmannii]|uniref:Inner membrane assembly complex subunit 17 n=1 Tax=Coniochaeta hoffmannii TaxID=91930 RepID=A0AA38VN85_9PEZI|nr:hypothetical protein NKR19_g7185 [Coniochaeta hoffmannii]